MSNQRQSFGEVTLFLMGWDYEWECCLISTRRVILFILHTGSQRAKV